MSITVTVEPSGAVPPEVDYRWDPDTDILIAQLRANGAAEGLSGSVEIEGADGSWIVLDVQSGHIKSVEVAVWPDVRKHSALQPPEAAFARVTVPARRGPAGLSALEEETPMAAESDATERIFHFRFGAPRASARAVRIARDIVLDVDARGTLAGLWLLNVPPFPADS